MTNLMIRSANTNHLWRSFGASILLLSICACGSGGGGSADSGAAPVADSPPPITTTPRSVSGAAVKGLISGARIEVRAIDSRGVGIGLPIQTTTTDASGNFSLTPLIEPGLVSSFGGRFTDESDQDPEGDGRRTIQLGADDVFESILFPGQTEVAITPYTQLLVIKSRREVSGDNFAQVLENNRRSAIAAFGFDPFNTLPTNPIAPEGDAGIEPRRYALMLGGIANAINSVSIQLGFAEPTFTIIQAVVDDLSDGRLDGMVGSDRLLVNVNGRSEAMPDNVSLADQSLRFANNNLDVYGGQRAAVDEEQLAEPGANELPQFSGTAQIEIPTGFRQRVSLGDIAAIDSDDGPVALRFTLLSLPPNGTFDLTGVVLAVGDSFTPEDVAAGALHYADAGSGASSSNIQLSVSDGADTVTTAITINALVDSVGGPNPVADSIFVDEGASTSVLVSGADSLLANDSDPDGDTLTAVLGAGPVHGSLILNTDGTFLYSHNGSETTEDSFTYRAADSTLQSPLVTVSIVINPDNDPPLFGRAPFGQANWAE